MKKFPSDLTYSVPSCYPLFINEKKLVPNQCLQDQVSQGTFQYNVSFSKPEIKHKGYLNRFDECSKLYTCLKTLKNIETIRILYSV